MDLSKIKNFIKQNGDKFIFVENGEPEMVVMSFHEYEKMLENGHADSHAAYARRTHDRMPSTNVSSNRFAFEEEFDMQGEEGQTKETEFRHVSGGEEPLSADHRVSRTHASVHLENVRLEDVPI